MTTSAMIGSWRISTIHDHVGEVRDPADVYPGVPPEAWEPYRSFALSAQGKWQSQWRGHLIRPIAASNPVIVVDTGMGPGPHAHTGRAGELLDSLAAEGIEPGDVDIVVITHCHGDHVGWNVTWNGATPTATFPNAVHYVPRADWEHYVPLDDAAFERSVRPLETIGQLALVTGEMTVAAGVTTYPAPGHTPGHQCVMVRSGDEVGVLTGDLLESQSPVRRETSHPADPAAARGG